MKTILALSETTLDRRHYLSAMMNIFWLRPETAVWRALDCLVLKDVDFRLPILDIGCGDGLFSFTRGGGLLDDNFDMFVHAGNLDGFYNNVDIYDHVHGKISPPVATREPAYRIAVGLDHKEALLHKADLLGFYSTTIEADANQPLPLDDGSFRTVYSNILYWLQNYKQTLGEIRRVLADDGQAVLQVPSETFRDYSFYNRLHKRTGDPRWEWLRLIDRGRSENIQLCRTIEQWREDFAGAGLKIVHHRRYLSKPVLEAWDIGLRPISPYLIEMANKLSTEDRVAIKRKWIDGLLPLLEPMCEVEWPTDDTSPPGFFMFVLEKDR